MNNKKIKVMIIDDSALMRNLISNSLSNNKSIDVVGTAINGNFGLKKLNSLKPDIIILDLEMPEMNGIEFLKERNRLGIKTPVIILSAHAQKGAKITLDALSLGASDFILKPSGSPDVIQNTKKTLIEMILALAIPDSYSPSDIISRISPLTKTAFRIAEIPELKIDDYLQPIKSIPDINILSIGISTGGPNALREILPLFPKDFPVPIVIVQHMPVGFTYEFAKSLDKLCSLSVKEASNGDILMPGRVFIAPGNMHIKFLKKKLATIIQLDDGPPVNGHKPSVDVLFNSTAKEFGQNALACIMTGMGKDGAENIGMLLRNGGITIAQDQNSSVVFGMPKVAIIKKNIQLVLPLNKIVKTIINIVERKQIDIN